MLGGLAPHTGEKEEDLLENALLETGYNADKSSAFLAAHYHLASGGNRSRSSLALTFSKKLNILASDAIKIAASIELLHNASLVHDDLMDKDQVRRGDRAVWAKFGNETAVCCGDLLISRAFLQCSQLTKLDKVGECIQLLSQSIEKTIYGQCLDVDHQAWSCLDSDSYCESVIQKTIPLLLLCFELPLTYSGVAYPAELVRKAVTHFALAYQIIDDLEDRIIDEKVDRSNYVSLLAQSMTVQGAESMAREKARYLILQCKTNEARLPAIAKGILTPGIEQLSIKLDRISKG